MCRHTIYRGVKNELLKPLGRKALRFLTPVRANIYYIDTSRCQKC